MKYSRVCAAPAMTTTDRGVVLVTRSEPGATELVQALAAAGYTAIGCPLLDVQRVDDPDARRTLLRLDDFDVVIFVSAHAVRFAFEAIDEHVATRNTASSRSCPRSNRPKVYSRWRNSATWLGSACCCAPAKAAGPQSPRRSFGAVPMSKRSRCIAATQPR